MNIKELQEAKRAKAKAQARKQAIQWLWILPALMVGLALWQIAPWLNKKADAVENPPMQPGIVMVDLLSDTKSDDQLRPRKSVANALCTINDTVARHLGAPIQTTIVRFGSAPISLYDGPNDDDALTHVLKADYLQANPDPMPGTLLAPALQYSLRSIRATKGMVVLVTVGTDAFEDTTAVQTLLTRVRTQARVILLVYGVPIHNPHVAKSVMDLRGQNAKAITSLGSDARVASDTDLPSVLEYWLPARLRAAGVPMN